MKRRKLWFMALFKSVDEMRRDHNTIVYKFPQDETRSISGNRGSLEEPFTIPIRDRRATLHIKGEAPKNTRETGQALAVNTATMFFECAVPFELCNRWLNR
ncbi:hypothetical protein LshimejAT787_1802060 [Lyophyllum shimeji]|uniref:Uncharacterized protein n=1 Tax=Lyophyllum shimeji TaxID=47721 RepID=A0A9P3Q0D1_LYOSH|nr:hypothetical protein LshimejAT787_1802060 [Lyophyllum shimeji]